MSKATQVILITGFLGAGKTTLLNRLVNAFPEDLKISILLNEFGEVNVDSQVVEADELDIWQVSRGSIFCVCVKSDFIKGLAKIAGSGDIDLLVIEATGVANPTELRRDLQLPIFKGRFELKEQICLLDAENFADAYDTFSAVEKQLESSTLFVLNKTDLASPGQIEQARAIIARHHTRPEIIETSQADLPMRRLLGGLTVQPDQTEAAPSPPSPEEVNALIRRLEGFVSLDSLPPDQLASRVFYFTGKNRAELRAALEALPREIVRAKGIVFLDQAPYLASRVMRQIDITPVNPQRIPPELSNLIVVIGRPDAVIRLVKNPSLPGLSPCEW